MKKRETKLKTGLLPKDPTAAVRSIMTVTNKLIAFADQEMRALTIGDMMKFALIQRDKQKYAEEYAAASQEFQARVEEFRVVDKTLLGQLDKLQIDLKSRSEASNTLIRQIRDRALTNTKGTLFTAQEMGQRVHFMPKIQPAANSTTQAGTQG